MGSLGQQRRTQQADGHLLATRSWRGISSWGLFLVKCSSGFSKPCEVFLAERGAWKVEKRLCLLVTGGTGLEYEQQRELWDWNTTKSAGVFGFVGELALGERRGKETGASVGFFFPVASTDAQFWF